MKKPIPLKVDIYPPSLASSYKWNAVVEISVPGRGRGSAQASTVGQAIQDALILALADVPDGSQEITHVS